MMPSLFPNESVIATDGPRLELVGDRRWIFRLPRELRSLNATMWGRWGGQKRERETWECEFSAAVASFGTLRSIDGWPRPGEAEAFRVLLAHRERRRVRVIRLVPHQRHFLRDAGNLRSVDKHVIDAMKHVGLIVDDRYAWLDHLPPAEFIAPDGHFSTVVQLDRPDARGLWRP